jgi:ATP-dependent DNA ligase
VNLLITPLCAGSHYFKPIEPGSQSSRVHGFDDGHALYDAVCERGLEGVVAKWRRASYRPGQRGWIKVKNPGYRRRSHEMAAMSHSFA